MTCHSEHHTQERTPAGYVQPTALYDLIGTIQTDLLFATTPDEVLSVAAHLRLAADQVERHAGRMMEQKP